MTGLGGLVEILQIHGDAACTKHRLRDCGKWAVGKQVTEPRVVSFQMLDLLQRERIPLVLIEDLVAGDHRNHVINETLHMVQQVTLRFKIKKLGDAYKPVLLKNLQLF
jgi:hypothetical protein